MEFLGLVGAIIGLISAIISRKQIIIHKTEPNTNPTSPPNEEAGRVLELPKTSVPTTASKDKQQTTLRRRIFYFLISIFLFPIYLFMLGKYKPMTEGLEFKLISALSIFIFGYLVYQFTAIIIILISMFFKTQKQGN